MANSRIYFKSEAGGTTVVSRDTTATSGNLVLPASGNVASVDTAVTDNAIARYDGTTGKLQNSSVTIDDNGNIGTGTQTFNGFGGSGFKNYIINGNFDIWQRGTSFTISGFTYAADRFIGFHSSGGTITKVAGPVGFYNAIQIHGSSSGNAILVQRIEASNSIALGRNNSGYATLSFYAKANVAAQPIHMNVIIPTTTDNYASSTIAKNIQVGVTSTGWTKYTYTFPLDFVYWGGIHLEMAGINVTTFAVSGVQLEEGSIATPFENRPIGLELSLCQRYYETSGNARIEEFRNLTTGILQYGAVRFMVEKRIPPSIVVMSDNTMVAGTVCQDNGTSVSVSINSSGTTGFRLHWTNTAGRFGASFHYTASAEL